MFNKLFISSNLFSLFFKFLKNIFYCQLWIKMQSGLNIIYAMLQWLDQKDYMCKQDNRLSI